jgi:hypothetical protein
MSSTSQGFTASTAVAALVVAIVPLVAATEATASSAVTARPPAQSTSHLGSTWDAPDAKVRILDHQAVTATVSVSTVRTPSDNALCTAYTSTFTLSWQALAGHKLTAVVTHDDGFGYGWRALDTTTWEMTPAGQVFDEQAPVVTQWYLNGTHRQSPLCPADTRTINHVEIYVDGAPRHEPNRSIVKPPSRNHLAAVWTWPDQVSVVPPAARVSVSLSEYHEIEQSEGPCEAHFTEIDVTFTALGSARIIAVGVRQPGYPIQYQNGNTDSYGLGTTSHEWFLTGTNTKSELCPADTVSTDRIEVYTDLGRRRG